MCGPLALTLNPYPQTLVLVPQYRWVGGSLIVRAPAGEGQAANVDAVRAERKHVNVQGDGCATCGRNMRSGQGQGGCVSPSRLGAQATRPLGPFTGPAPSPVPSAVLWPKPTQALGSFSGPIPRRHPPSPVHRPIPRGRTIKDAEIKCGEEEESAHHHDRQRRFLRWRPHPQPQPCVKRPAYFRFLRGFLQRPTLVGRM